MAELKPGWKRVKFDDMVTSAGATRKARGWTAEEAGVDRYVGIEHLDPNSLTIRRWGSPGDVGENSDLRHFEPGDVILARRGIEQRKVGVAAFAGVTSGHALVFRARPGVVLPEFLPYFLLSDAFMGRAEQFSAGSLSKTVNLSTLLRLEFALPPLEEQRRVVGVLRAFDRLVDALGVAQATLDETRTSYLEHIFARPDQSPRTLIDVADLLSGGTPSRSNSDFWNGSVPWLSPKDMKRRVIFDTEEHISDAAVDAGARRAPAGSLFIVVRGMILAHTFPICRCDREIAFNQDVKAVAPKGNTHAGFLEAWFEWAAPRLLRRASTTTHGTKRIETDQLLSVPFPSLSKSEQAAAWLPFSELATRSAGIGARISALANMRHAVLETFEELT